MAEHDGNRARALSHKTQRRSRQGCQTCRSRKVKCDEEHPQCRACVRINRDCVWTRSWIFCDQSNTVAKAYTVVEPIPQDASGLSIDMSNIITMSSEGEYTSDSFGDADSESLAEWDILPSISLSPSRMSTSSSDILPLELIYRRGFRMRPSVNTPNFDRNQALVAALSHYLPVDELSFRSNNPEDWLRMSFLSPHNSALFNPRVPALAAAVDTFSLTHAAVKLQDDSLAQQAIKRYIIAVALLRESIAQIADYDRNEVLLAILILQITEPFSPISQAGGWLTHVDGAAKVFQYEGPRLLKSVYDTALFSHVRRYAIVGGLMRREHTFFGSSQWLAVSQSAPAADHETRLLDIGSTIPALLARTDKVRMNNAPEHIVHELLQKLDSACQAVMTWLNEFSSSMEHEISTTIDIKEMEAYNEEMDGDSTFLPVFRFASFRTAWRMTLGWTFYITVLKAILDILTTRGDISYKHEASDIGLKIFHVVTNLSMVIPQLFARHFGAMSRVAMMVPLRIATTFYLARGQTKELDWCKRVGKAVFSSREGLNHIWVLNNRRDYMSARAGHNKQEALALKREDSLVDPSNP